MKKMNCELNSLFFFLFILFFFTNHPYSQEYGEKDYSWLYLDRILPLDSLPVNAFKDAVDFQFSNRQTEGYSFSSTLARWKNIGPSNSFYNGRIVRVKYDPINDNTVYVCGHNGGVWRSDNAQATPSDNVVFNFKTLELQTQSSGDIAIDPQDNNTIYYGTGGNVFGIVYNYYGIGVYKSTNRGDNWIGPLTNGLPPLIYTSAIVVNPSNQDIYLANGWGTGPYGSGQGAGLYKSSNGGNSWVKVVPSQSNVYSSCYDVAVSQNGQFVHVATQNGYWRSIDFGATFTWQDPEGRGFPYINGRTQIDVSQQNPNYVYMVTDQVSYTPPPNQDRIDHNYSYVSTDGGNNFSRTFDFGIVSFMTNDFFYVKVSPHNPETAFVGWGGGYTLYRTANGGANFSLVNVAGRDQNNFAFNPNPLKPNQAFECNDQGAFISNNITAINVFWNNVNYSLSVRGNYRVASNPYNSNDIVAAATDAGFFKYWEGLTWNETHQGNDGTAMVHTKSPIVNAFIGGKGANNNGLHWSTDGGGSFVYTEISNGYIDGSLDWTYPIVEKPGPSNYGIFFTPRRNSGTHSQIDINVSYNYGQSWTNNTTNTGINPINSGDGSFSPQWMTVCDANTNLMYVTTKRWLDNPSYLSQVWRSSVNSNGQIVWNDLDITNHGIPNRVVTTVVADPLNENIVYLTLSGFNENTPGHEGHVFKSFNKGANWVDISSGPPHGSTALPNLPVNYLLIRKLSGPGKELIVGTDAGVYSTFDNEGSPAPLYKWVEVAEGLPNTICLGLDYNLSSNKLRAALFGRGIWEVTLPGAIYIVGNEILSSYESGLEVGNDIVVTAGSTLTFPVNCTIKMPEGKKIIVEPGGKIEVSTGASVTFTSQSGEWGGIEFQGDAYGTLKNCTFLNTSTPIVVNGDPYNETESYALSIDNCNFSSPIEINNRKNVLIEYCNFNYSSGSAPTVLGIFAAGADNSVFTNNSINSSSSVSSTGISVIYGSGIVVQKNEINNMAVGISISNSSPLVSQNRITNSSSSSAVVGIGFDNSYSAAVKQNTVIGYQVGYKLYNSSPEMYMDSSYNTGTSGDSVNGLHAVYLSNPRLKPSESGRNTIWDAGKNNLKTINKGNGVYMYISSVPILDYGYNHIWGYDNYLFGDGPEVSEYYARCNTWVDDPPNAGELNLTSPGSVIYSPYGCTPPGGSGSSSVMVVNNPIEDIEDPENPPALIVINYGHGIYDTIKLTTGAVDPPADQNAFGEAVSEELNGNFSIAVTKYKNLLSNYQASILARNSLKKILNCYVKMNADSNQYTELRKYYLSLVQQNPSDTAFVKAAKELAAKTLVKKGEFSNAITEYENLISGNSDIHDVLCYELNIIETYMIMAESGDSPGFTGNIASLKPVNKRDGYRKIMEKLYGVKSMQNNPVIPVKFSLSQNYPNPFNPVTKINYSLPSAVKVNINVYDIIGRLVKTLVNEFKEAGSYDIQFNGAGLASGVYFYRIEAGDFVDSKKMVLVK